MLKKRKISPLKNSIIVENHPAHFQQHSKPWFGRRATRADRWSNRKFRKFQRIVDERASFAAISRECPTHIRPPCFETRRCRNENRFSSRCSALSTPLLRGRGSEEACVERDCLSLLLSLRPSEGMEIDNIPLFEPVSPRPYGVFFYLVTWFFPTFI